MIVSKETYYYDAFILDQGNLRKLANVFEQCIHRPTFEIECCDGSSRKFDDLTGLLSFENGWSHRIRSLWIRSFDDEKMRRARVRFSAVHAPVYLEIAAESEISTAVDDEVTGRVEEMRPRYRAMSVFDLGLALLAGIAAAVSACSATLAWRSFWHAAAGADLAPVMIFSGAETACLVLSLAAVWLASRPKGPLFPRAAFALGRGIYRKRLLAVFRWALSVAMAGSLLAIIILNIGL